MTKLVRWPWMWVWCRVRGVFSDDGKCLPEEGEWARHWDPPAVQGRLDLVQWWESMGGQLPTVAPIALRTLSIPHALTNMAQNRSQTNQT